jgi:hypothetical protein
VSLKLLVAALLVVLVDNVVVRLVGNVQDNLNHNTLAPLFGPQTEMKLSTIVQFDLAPSTRTAT